jgi:glycosyltransferase involved in cell wall biosynthesis
MKKLAIITFVYNEKNQLPRWISHYAKHVEQLTDLYVIDHGSNDGSIDFLPSEVNIIRLKRTDGYGIYQAWRVDFVSRLIASLLEKYDAAVYVDCDEYLVVDPSKANSLVDYVSKEKYFDAYSNSAIGFDVLHDYNKEVDLEKNLISEVRKKIMFVAAMCKPVLVKDKNVRWGGGFHVSNQKPSFGDIYLFHLRYGDKLEGLSRLAITREIERPEMKFVPCDHHKIEDSMYIGWIDTWLKYQTEHHSILSKECSVYDEINKFSHNLGNDGLYHFDYSFRSNKLYEIPVEFMGIL